MKKNVKAAVIFSVLLVLFSIIGGYIGLIYFYSENFITGTWINGTYCTGMNVEAANELLCSQTPDKISIVTEDGTQQIPFSAIWGEISFKSKLENLLMVQTPVFWGKAIFDNEEYEISPDISFDEQLLQAEVKKLDVIMKQNLKALQVTIIEGDAGYELLDNRKHVLNEEKVLKAVMENLEAGNTTIDLSLEDCYEDLEYDEAMLSTITLWEKADAFQNSCHVIYDMGDQKIPVDASVVCHWIELNEDNAFVLDKDGNLILDESGIEEFINELSAQYDTYGKPRNFTTTAGNTIEISGGTYGSMLNQKKENAYLTNAFLEGTSEEHIPDYLREGSVRGKDDIGDTYIEIDMTNQCMYYYEAGELILETEVVTGNVAARHKTPEGVNYVYAKQKNRILRGPGYASFVSYWMPVKGGIGIHDATWRDEFGGDIYLTDGSHGCINTPLEKMEILYEKVSIGTPVVMYY